MFWQPLSFMTNVQKTNHDKNGRVIFNDDNQRNGKFQVE